MNYDALFTPFQYKGLTLRNRFIMAPMTRMFAQDGVPAQINADYYTRRAAAEVGLILTEGTTINRTASKNAKDIPDFHGDAALAGWRHIVQSVHAAGGAIAPQIWHVGKVLNGMTDWLPPTPLESPDEMSTEDIHATIKAFGDAAKAAKEAGFDAFEIHGAHGYLIDQFFWDGANHRTDEWGGKTIKERSRFAVAVVKEMRRQAGPDMVIILRLSQWKQQDYSAKLAANPDELEDWVLPLAEAGVDIFHASQRRYWDPEFEGSDLNFAGWIKKITGQPTITVGSVGLQNDVSSMFRGEGSGTDDLNELMRRHNRGDFDLVAVGRSILQDPEWVLKVKQNRFDDIQAFSPASLGQLY